ncbi:hypothetical protein D3C86_1578030 [compost metagenome]
MGADQALEIGCQLDPFQFQRQRIAVGIGDQYHSLAGLLDGRQKGIGIGTQGDQVGCFQFQFAHRQLELRAPEVQAIPAQLAGIFLEQRLQFHFGHGPADAMQLGIALGQMLQPEVVVVVQVEQGAVHVQQNGVDITPGNGRHTKDSQAVMGQH